MKKIAAMFAVALLAGCSMLPQVYDNNEYQLLAQLETTVQLMAESCENPDNVRKYLPQLRYDARLLNTYTFYTPQNTETYEITSILKEDAEEMVSRYQEDPSTLYCKLKTQTFLEKVRTALEVVAKKKRI